MKFLATYTVTVPIVLDESKFTEQFMQEFRESFYDFRTLEEHAAHIGQLVAREIITRLDKDQFVEGYGPLDEMGIRIGIPDVETEATRERGSR